MPLIEREVRDLETLRLIGYLGLMDARPRMPGIYRSFLISRDGEKRYDIDIGICGQVNDSNETVYTLVVISHGETLEFWENIRNFRKAPNPLMEWLAKSRSET